MISIYDLSNTFSYAMHGNGAYKGLRQTNSKDALEHWYGKGVRVFEIDLAKTSDERYVAVAHNVNAKDLRRMEIFEKPEAYTTDWFMGQKLFSISSYGLTPLSLSDILALMLQHKDMVVMLDLFGMFDAAAASSFTAELADLIDENVELWNRLLIEAYNSEMVGGISAITTQAHIIFCVRYEENIEKEKTISARELQIMGVEFVSYPWYCSVKHPGELEAYTSKGIIVFSRTKDNTKKRKLQASGVSVNLIANRYDGIKILYQWPLYMMTYIKRVLVKVYIKLKY